MSLILSIDAGTTSLKGALFDETGNLMACRIHEYALEHPAPDWVELDPEIYWHAAESVVAALLKETNAPAGSIAALGVTSQGETLIALDRNGKPLRKAIVWMDNRARIEADSIRNEFSQEQVYRATGQQDIAPCWPAAKLLWLQKNEPKVFKIADKFLMLADYLIYRLTGNFATDRALNPSTLYFDITQGDWWDSMLNFLSIDRRRLPSLLNSGEVAGHVVANIGLSPKTRVTVAPIDQVASALGAGNLAQGMITETTGSAMAVCATVDRPIYDPRMRIGLYMHARPGLYVMLPWIPTAGMILRWFRDEFGAGASYAELEREAAAAPAGCDGLVLLPHFSGMNSPEINPDACGVFFGITPAHRKAHFIRAILEAVAFALRDNLDLLAGAGVACAEITSLGGAARGKLWLQIKADVLQLPIRRMACAETTSLGAAILAACGTGIHSDIEAATNAMARPRDLIQPNPMQAELYNRAFLFYKKLNMRCYQGAAK